MARGLVLAGWRLLRCNPFSYGGYDPVEEQRLFKWRQPRTAELSAGQRRRIHQHHHCAGSG